ncbi:hypothetical protein LCGC14_0614570 [marine sediment metagenome]|uniref:Homeodomain phBC6A51-type domain-containing protein n=1 Tax=marine sediment metagenome TaxID=412755 RepID=A0A0F9RQV1_9ZZZZ
MNELTVQDKKDLFIILLEANQGHVANTCKAMNISRACYYLWRAEDEDFKGMCHDVKEGLIDHVEGKLMDLINVLDFQAIKTYLAAYAKNRGYGTAVDVNVGGQEGNPLTVVGVLPPEPESLEDWEKQVGEARTQRLLEEGKK